MAVALGSDTHASGYSSTALGTSTNATGLYSTALGSSTNATGTYSTAMGQNSTASGYQSLAAGYLAEAAGTAAFSLGHHTSAESFCEISLGIYPTLQSGSATTRVSTDRLFEIGNGTGNASRSNAITILKDARTGFGTMDTDAEITHALTLPNSGTATGQGRAQAWTTYSDSRIKTAQRPITYGLKEIMRLQPRAYTQHSGCVERGKFKCADEHGGSTATIGFIAQEVEQVIPEAVQKPDDPANQLYGMSYEKLIPVLVKAAQELKAENDILKAGNTTLEKQLNATNAALGALQQRLERLERRKH